MVDIQKRESAILRTFSNIGKSNGTAPSAFTDNRSSIADELYVSYMLYSLADKRREAAKADAIAAGIVGEFDQLRVGSHLTFNADGYAITVRRNQDSEMLDKTLLRAALVSRFGVEVAEDIIQSATKPRRGQTSIQVSLG